MTVAQCVDHPAPLLAGVDRAGRPQPGQMPADGGPRGTARLRERRDIGLARRQGVQQRERGAVAEQGQQCGGRRELLLAGTARVRIVRR